MRLCSISIIFASASAAMATNLSSSDAAPVYAPIPAAAVGPGVSIITGYRIDAFGQGAYMLTDGIYQALFMIACDGVIVVDAPPTLGHKLLKGIRTLTDSPISHVIYSHAHADHIAAAYLLSGPNVTIIAHEETLKELAQVNDTHRPAPDITFSDELDLNICNQTLKLSYKGPNHQPGNIFIHAPAQKILMLVDVVFPGWVPYDSLAESHNIPGFISAHDQILDYDFEHYVGGHLNRAGTRQDVINQRDYMTDLYDSCIEAIELSAAPPNSSNPLSAQIALAPVIAANPGNLWAITSAYVHDIVASYCANKTTAAWLGRLAGADVFGQANAVTMISSLRFDYGVLGPNGVTDT